MTSLYHLTEDYRHAIDELLGADLPAEAIADTLEGMKGELKEKALNVGAYIANLESDAAQMKDAYTRMKVREKQTINKAERLRTYLKDCLNKLDIGRVQNNELTVKLNKPRYSVVITDLNKLPENFVCWESKPDKAAIKKALDSGETIQGAVLELGASSVSIR